MSLVVAGVVALTTMIAGGATSAPVGAAPVGFTLTVPEGQGGLSLRGSTEPTVLGSPITITGTVDDQTGALSSATFATPTLRTERPVTQPVEAIAVIDATFSPESPTATTGNVDSDGNLTIQTRLVVDLHVEVFLDPSLPPAIVADCRAAPVVLTLESVSPYVPDGGGTVTVIDEDFTIPAPANAGSCNGPVYDALQDELTGPGHSVSMTLNGTLALPEPPGALTVTTLTVDPAGHSRLGAPVTLTATVAPGPDSTEPGTPAGLVDFLVDGRIVGTETLDHTGNAVFTTDTLPSGTVGISARYKGQTPFRSSPSPIVEHLVAPDPTITLPDYVAHGGAATEFDLVVDNPQGGVQVAMPQVKVAFVRQPTSSSTLSGLALERLSGEDWIPVPLSTVAGVSGVSGAMTDASWGPLAPGGQLTVRLRLAAGAPTQAGSMLAVVSYLGDDHRLPSQTSLTIDVVPAGGPAFECRSSIAGGDLVTGFNLVALASLPSHAPSGATVPIVNQLVRALFDRGPSYSSFTSVLRNGTYTVGEDVLRGVVFDYGPEGTGTATGYDASNASLMTATGSDPDLVMDMKGESGSVTIAGKPGDVVPVTLESITFNFLDPIAGGIPYDIVCEPLGGPVELGRVTVAGVSLSVDAPSSARVGDDVTLSADVVPGDGSVEFFAGETSLGVARVVDGRAVRTTDDIPAGDHAIIARHTSARMVVESNGVDLTVLPEFDCEAFVEEGSGAVVRLVYLELLGRCPDQAGFDYWTGRLAGGTSAEVFARSIARTPEAVGRVVDDAYVTMLGRPADAAGRAFWTGRLSANGRYDALLADLGASGEFWSRAGSTNEGFVTRVYDRLLNRAPDAAGLAYWVGRLDAGASRRALIVSLANLDEPLGRIATASYGEILARAPFAAERSDAVTFLRATGDRSGLYAQLIGRPEFATRAQSLPNQDD